MDEAAVNFVEQLAQRPRCIGPDERDDAECAAVVATILDFDKRPAARPLHDPAFKQGRCFTFTGLGKFISIFL